MSRYEKVGIIDTRTAGGGGHGVVLCRDCGCFVCDIPRWRHVHDETHPVPVEEET